MGIADDIRPKKYRPISKKASGTARKHAKKEIEDREPAKLFSNTHDGDFFGGTPLNNFTAEDKPIKKSHRWIYTLTICLAAAILIGLVVWQNYSQIKSYFDGSYKKSNDTNLSEIIDSASTTDNQNYSSDETQANPSSDQTTTTPAAPQIDKSSIKVSVLNGSGVKSSAATAATVLRNDGFNVASTANARSFNYASSIIYYKTGGEDKANLVKSALSGYQTETRLSDAIVGTSYDIVVVVGKS